MGEWSLSTRAVDEDADADADAQRFVADEVVEESPARMGACFGVWVVTVVCKGEGKTMIMVKGACH